MRDFRTFPLRGDVVSLAVAVVVGVAFTAVVTSLVEDPLTLLIAAVVGEPDFSELAFTVNEGVVRHGELLNALIALISIAAAVFFLVVRPVTPWRSARGEERTHRTPPRGRARSASARSHARPPGAPTTAQPVT